MKYFELIEKIANRRTARVPLVETARGSQAAAITNHSDTWQYKIAQLAHVSFCVGSQQCCF